MNNDLKVCPNCGSCPWDMANPGELLENQPAFCQDCGERLVPRSELPRDIWKDPYVREALKDGRSAYGIAVCRCPECNQPGYYNEGSSFSCRFCNLTFRVIDPESEEWPDDVRAVSTEDVCRLDDTITECTDGYSNRTL